MSGLTTYVSCTIFFQYPAGQEHDLCRRHLLLRSSPNGRRAGRGHRREQDASRQRTFSAERCQRTPHMDVAEGIM